MLARNPWRQATRCNKAALHGAALTQAALGPTMALARGCGSEGSPVSQQLSRAAVSAIACGAFIVLLSFGIRSSFGLFLQPMSLDLGWGREVFALAMAIQNLLWGLSQPFVGAIADKWGTARTIVGGSLLYILGVYLMSTTSSPPELYFSAGVLVGLGLSGTGFGVVLAAVGRSVPAERRSVALGITTAVGSLGVEYVVIVCGA